MGKGNKFSYDKFSFLDLKFLVDVKVVNLVNFFIFTEIRIGNMIFSVVFLGENLLLSMFWENFLWGLFREILFIFFLNMRF